MDDFILRAALAGSVVALLTGILGCFVVWRKMAYFGDSLAHSTLLGIAIGIPLGISSTLSVIIACLCFAALLLWIQQKQTLATDTILGILAHSGLAFGMVAISFGDAGNIDLHAILFGDLLLVSQADLLWLAGGGALVLTALFYYWQPLLMMSINSDLAAAEGSSVLRLHILLVSMMTITVAVSINIIGVLLIASLLIIPAATARLLAKSPETMACLAVAAGIGATLFGLMLSLQLDVPAGPAVVSIAALFFIAASLATANS